jgi:hypothetical protein
MSMYNMIFDHNPGAGPLIALINHAHEADFANARLRDAWVEKDGDAIVIRVHTRVGGGNREAHASAIDSLRAHPWYVRDDDMDFDTTYADFYFRPDLDWVASLGSGKLTAALVGSAIDHVDMAERWAKALEGIEKSS